MADRRWNSLSRLTLLQREVEFKRIYSLAHTNLSKYFVKPKENIIRKDQGHAYYAPFIQVYFVAVIAFLIFSFKSGISGSSSILNPLINLANSA